MCHPSETQLFPTTSGLCILLSHTAAEHGENRFRTDPRGNRQEVTNRNSSEGQVVNADLGRNVILDRLSIYGIWKNSRRDMSDLKLSATKMIRILTQPRLGHKFCKNRKTWTKASRYMRAHSPDDRMRRPVMCFGQDDICFCWTISNEPTSHPGLPNGMRAVYSPLCIATSDSAGLESPKKNFTSSDPHHGI